MNISRVGLRYQLGAIDEDDPSILDGAGVYIGFLGVDVNRWRSHRPSSLQ